VSLRRKGYVFEAVDVPSDDDAFEETSKKTCVRRPCPLCNGSDHVSSDNPGSSLTNSADISARADVSAVACLLIELHCKGGIAAFSACDP
jgi:hypothetical protein